MPPRLRRLAEDAADQPFGTAIEASPETVEAARSAAELVRRRLDPANAKQRAAILFALADVVGKPEVIRNGDAAAQRRFWAAYHADLGHLPAAVLSRACAAWRRSGETWFPTPGQLLRLARGDEDWRADAALALGLERLSKARAPEAERANSEADWAVTAARLASLKGRWSDADAAAAELRRSADSDALAWFKAPRPRNWLKRHGAAR